MKKGRAGTMTHDYKRHGTTTLFAALDVLEGKVTGRCMARHPLAMASGGRSRPGKEMHPDRLLARAVRKRE
jgi:hypothetical protein